MWKLINLVLRRSVLNSRFSKKAVKIFVDDFRLLYIVFINMFFFFSQELRTRSLNHL